MRNSIGLLLFLSLLLGGCRPAASTALPPSALTLKPCTVAGSVQAECGALHVPEDRTHPAGRNLDLDIVVVHARAADHEPDPVFYIAGGPGNADTDPGIVSGVAYLLREVNARRDLVFLDQRGTNGKHRLACDFIPDEIFDGPQQKLNDWFQKNCLASLDGDPRFYTTAVAMRDLDDARAALGYQEINLFGISYGVAAEQVYMRMFPEHVRAVVMDHGTALDLPFFYVKPRASQYALDQVLAYCEQDEKCHAAYPDIRGDWKKILDRFADGPVATSYIPPGMDTPASLTLEGLADGIHQLMYKSGTYIQIPSLLHTLATAEDWGPIVKSYQEQYGSSGGEDRLLLMPHVIFCSEPAWGIQPDQVERFSPGSYYSSAVEEWAQNEQKLCAALPKPDPALIYGPGKPVPLSALMFNSLIDPQNPPSNMDLALKEFTKSRVVVEPTEGHDTSASPCRWEIVAQYIEQGSVDGLDISCMEKQKPSFVTGD
ncbi:MAG TPA: alpha/beta hydrolase [Anaerolineales bacterium]|nr:alpha/beta hydrolase [Anaerolineales bacterium]